MKFAVFGGDGRTVRLVRLLREDGHDVRTFALDKALSGGSKTAFDAADGADCAIFPLPCAKNGALNAPFSSSAYDIADILSVISPGTLVCAGMADAYARLHRITHRDLLPTRQRCSLRLVARTSPFWR